MFVQDVRMPVQPAVPVVQALSSGATATNTEKAKEDPRLVWGGSNKRGRNVGFSPLDRSLIRAVTGEDVEIITPPDLSAFAFQILTDRHNGRLPAGREVDLDYLSRTHRRLLGLGEANPFAGALLKRAVQFVESRASGRIDIAM